MATTITNNLYPPFVDAYMPAFNYMDNCRLYFSIPELLNVEKDLNGFVQLSLVNPITNSNQLNMSQYPAGILRRRWSYDSNIDDDDKYYIDISPTDLVGTNININLDGGNTGKNFSVKLDIDFHEGQVYDEDGEGTFTFTFSKVDNFILSGIAGGFKRVKFKLFEEKLELGYIKYQSENNQWAYCSTIAPGALNQMYTGDNAITTMYTGNSNQLKLKFPKINVGNFRLEMNFDTTPLEDLEGPTHLCFIEDNNCKSKCDVSFYVSDGASKASKELFNNTLYLTSNIRTKIESEFNDKFNIDGYYKAQLRFEKEGTPAPSSFGVTNKWITKNQDNFSEWSTVCLLKAISPPELTLSGFSKEPTQPSKIKEQIINLTGGINFGNSLGEYLMKYRVRLMKNSTELYNSGWLIPDADNYISDTIEYLLTETGDWYYDLKIDIETNNLYRETFNKKFSVKFEYVENPVKTFTATMDNKNGGVKLDFTTYHKNEVIKQDEDGNDVLADPWNKYYIIRRSDDTSDFRYWDIIKKIDMPLNHVYKYSCYDYTCEVGTFYKYAIQVYDKDMITYTELKEADMYDNFIENDTVMGFSLENSVPITLNIVTSEKEKFQDSIKENNNSDDFFIEDNYLYKVEQKIINADGEQETKEKQWALMPYLDDIFLTSNGNNLCIKFDPSIGSVSNNKTESIIPTIGSRFPFVIKSGKSDYRTFSLGGTISTEMDEDNLFTSKTSIYKNYQGEHELFKNKASIQRDFIYERKFREKVNNYLNDGKVKLYRSTQEGNILVKLTDINLNPKGEIGRFIYEFSATATEIDNCNIINYNDYKVQKRDVKLKTIQILDSGGYYEYKNALFLDGKNALGEDPTSTVYRLDKESGVELKFTEYGTTLHGIPTVENAQESYSDGILSGIDKDIFINAGKNIIGYEILVEED